MRSVSEKAETRSASLSPSYGGAGRASGASGSMLYSRPAAKSSRGPRATTASCGWYEHNLYDVAIAMTEVPLKPHELEYRERTVFSPIHPPPVEIPSSPPPPVVLKVKAKPKACAPPHPSTVRVCYEPEVVPLPQPQTPEVSRQNSRKLDKSEKPPKSRENEEKQEAAELLAKEDKRLEKGEKAEKSDKAERQAKDKHAKHDKKKTKEPNADGIPKEELDALLTRQL